MGDGRSKDLIGTVLQDTYKIERRLGSGGMGAVYEASHSRLRRRFAIKLLHGDIATNAETMARFRREAEITSGLGHANIIEVIDFNHTPDGAPYIVMELLKGRDLGELLERVPCLELARAVEIFCQTASALQAAHDQNIVHRDLKPGNIFICERGGGEIVKVLDFGISKVVGSQSHLTQAHTTMGTPLYMSPEQAEGSAADVDARSDIFSMGSILYQMLSGKPPFVGTSIPAILYKVSRQDPAPLRSAAATVPIAVEQALGRALQKKREDRYPSMDAFAQALRQACASAGAPITPQGLESAQTTAAPSANERSIPETLAPGTSGAEQAASITNDLSVPNSAIADNAIADSAIDNSATDDSDPALTTLSGTAAEMRSFRSVPRNYGPAALLVLSLIGLAAFFLLRTPETPQTKPLSGTQPPSTTDSAAVPLEAGPTPDSAVRVHKPKPVKRVERVQRPKTRPSKRKARRIRRSITKRPTKRATKVRRPRKVRPKLKPIQESKAPARPPATRAAPKPAPKAAPKPAPKAAPKPRDKTGKAEKDDWSVY